MELPFSKIEFIEVLRSYNAAIWPAQIVAYLLGVTLLCMLARPGERCSRAILGVLAIFWIWNGLAYHIGYFARINSAAYVFGALFVLQGLFFGALALRGVSSHYRVRPDLRSAIASASMLYALVVYQLFGHWSGHGFMNGPLFGVAPCPTTIFTLGLLLLARPALPFRVWIIPLLWAAIGTSAAFALDVREDLGLGVVAILAAVSMWSTQRADGAPRWS